MTSAAAAAAAVAVTAPTTTSRSSRALVSCLTLLFCAGVAQAGDAHAGPAAPRQELEVVFTFDDGPHDTYTPLILEELKKHKVQAVFFWVGRRLSGKSAEGRRKIATDAVAEGHLVGNHTMSHAHLCKVPVETAAREIDDAATLIAEVTGLSAGLFRAPYGDSCERLQTLLSERGLTHTGWNIDPMEWKFQSASHTASHVIGRLGKMQGRAILLLHDNQRVIVHALPVILDWIDEENARRTLAGVPLIRVVGGSELFGQQAPILSPWQHWFSMSSKLFRTRYQGLLQQLSPFGL